MNAPAPSLATLAGSASALPLTPRAAQIIHAARLLAPDLTRGQPVTSAILRSAMETACGGSDADGAWVWRDAYDACEAAQVLFLRKHGPAMRRQAATAAALLAMLERVAALFPTQTRRSADSQALQQFSTPIGLGFVAAHAAGVTEADIVLEPSAGTGLLAIFAEWGGASLALNELADIRADLLETLFPSVAITRHDAAQIDDRLDEGVRPSVVLMNPPFSVVAHVDGKVRDAALRHLSSAFARLAVGGRLVAITGAGLSPGAPHWREAFVRLQERGRVVFSAAINGRLFAAHGTAVETRLTVIDKIAADNLSVFPPCLGVAPDAATLLDWVVRAVPPRQPLAPAPAGRSARTPIGRSTALGSRTSPRSVPAPCPAENRSRRDRTRVRDCRLETH